MNEKELLRSNIARGIEDGASGVDREIKHSKGIGAIFGYAVINKGKLNDGDVRDWEMDDTSLDQVIKLGNKSKQGLKVRFGHPNMSNTALGTFLGRAKKFRRDGDIVRADLYFDKTAYTTPDGDLASYVMDLAENDADAFGSSLVFTYELEYRLEKDGTRKKDKAGNELPPLVRYTKLFASDVVDDPAATKGMFGSFFSGSVMPSAEMTAFLDRFLSNTDAVEKTIAFLQRYAVNQEYLNNKTKKIEEVEGMEINELTLEMLKKERPDLVEALVKESETSAFEKGKTEGKEEGNREGVKLERERAAGILKKAKAYSGLEDVAIAAVEAGDTVETTESKLKDARLKELEKNAPPAPGPGSEKIKEADLSNLPPQERAEKEWDRDINLHSEFTSKEAYVAFRKAELAGKAKILKK